MTILRLISILFIIVAVMLLGADVVSALEQTDEMIPRSLNHILVLCGFDAMEWFAQNLPLQFAHFCITVVSWPGWARTTPFPQARSSSTRASGVASSS